MSWKDIVKARTGSKRGGSKPDRKKVLTKPKGSGTLHEDIKAFKEGKLEGAGPFDEELSPEELEEMKEFYALYPELDEYELGNVLENPQWVKGLKKPDKPYTVAHHLSPEQDFLIRDLQQKMVDNLGLLFSEFSLFLGTSGFETSRIDPENNPSYQLPIKRDGRFQQHKSFTNLFPLYSKLIKQLTWDDNWKKEANLEGFDVSKNILWGVKTIHYDVKARTGANVRHRSRDRSSMFEYESEPAGQPSMVHVLVFMRGTIDFENLDYKFYTLKYTTGMEKDIIPSSKTAQVDRRESDYREITDDNYRSYYRHMLNAAETDVLTISGDEPDSAIINKLRSFFGYYLRL